jgi:hypothetical protein
MRCGALIEEAHHEPFVEVATGDAEGTWVDTVRLETGAAVEPFCRPVPNHDGEVHLGAPPRARRADEGVD